LEPTGGERHNETWKYKEASSRSVEVMAANANYSNANALVLNIANMV